MSLLRDLTTGRDRLVIGLEVFCPGCHRRHHVITNAEWASEQNPPWPVWGFDGNLERPTFEGSLGVYTRPDYSDGPGYYCHSFIRDGQWEFLSDCLHDLAGQTAPMVDWDDVPPDALC